MNIPFIPKFCIRVHKSIYWSITTHSYLFQAALLFLARLFVLVSSRTVVQPIISRTGRQKWVGRVVEFQLHSSNTPSWCSRYDIFLWFKHFPISRDLGCIFVETLQFPSSRILSLWFQSQKLVFISLLPFQLYHLG